LRFVTTARCLLNYVLLLLLLLLLLRVTHSAVLL
jgi:hypothetical protein